MKRLQTLSPGLRDKIQAHRFAKKTKIALLKTARNVGQEGKETRDMAQTFFRMLENKLDMQNRKEPPSPDEVKEAIHQLKDVGRFSLFTGISILPGGAFSLIGLEILAKKLGVKNFTLVPSAFRKKQESS